MHLILRWIINAAALLLVPYLLPGVTVASAYAALVAAALLGLANAIIRPVLLVLTFPITIVTLGLFTFVINALMVWLVSSVVKGFDVATFSAAFWAALFFWIVGWITNAVFEQ